MKKSLVLITLLLSSAYCLAQVFDSSTAATKATTAYGEVAGYIDNGVYTYKGLPYAKAERFLPAVKPD